MASDGRRHARRPSRRFASGDVRPWGLGRLPGRHFDFGCRRRIRSPGARIRIATPARRVTTILSRPRTDRARSLQAGCTASHDCRASCSWLVDERRIARLGICLGARLAGAWLQISRSHDGGRGAIASPLPMPAAATGRRALTREIPKRLGATATARRQRHAPHPPAEAADRQARSGCQSAAGPPPIIWAYADSGALGERFGQILASELPRP